MASSGRGAARKKKEVKYSIYESGFFDHLALLKYIGR